VSAAAPAGWRLRHLPTLLAASAALLLAAAVAGWLARGGAGAAGAAAGVGLVVGSYTLSTLVVAWADSVAPALVLPFGLGTYVVKFTLIGVVMASIAKDWPGLEPLGLGVVAAVLVWTTVQIVWTYRTRPQSG
jgi:phosphotransferase system  glucose/maltose/N-acetylglucosamine-specific IIC component